MNTTMTMAPAMPQPAMVLTPSKKMPDMLKTIPVRQPSELYDRFALAFNNGDVDTIMTLFDEAGQTVPFPGQPPVIGLPAIRALMQQCLALRPQIRYESVNVLQADEIALLTTEWRLPFACPIATRRNKAAKAFRLPDASPMAVGGC